MKERFADLEELFLQYEKLIYLFLRDKIAETDLIYEYNQIFWLRVCENRERILELEKSEIKAYLRVVAYHIVAEYQRTGKAEQEMLKDYAFLRQMETGGTAEEAETWEDESLRQALNRLAEEEQAFILLYYTKGMTSEKLGNLTGMKPELVRARAMRIRKKLKAEILRLRKEEEDTDGR